MTATRKIIYSLSLATIATSLLLTSGCSNKTLSDYVTVTNKSEIITNPPGATIVVDDKEVGTSPMIFEGENIFPPHWEGTSYMVKSRLEVKRNGCKTETRIIKDPIPKSINIKLDCQEQYRVEEPTHAQPMMQRQSAPMPAPVMMPKSVEDRLLQIQNLYKKGLITDAENAELRKKALKDL
ncbi:hypothetical protein [sulfur-oxidizing endosymbiont of Gigantopelta aegis]|uniref:hypothetical protein n=1 Tax=sulfur-oxidizing endosymbiont of Gigantopelta aegis TaxID=2794934 RepID=UPI0018DC01AE|nr:hypothetical protein [sulfur-oxidizing endosymbiont of Gigantopelta aegis]